MGQDTALDETDCTRRTRLHLRKKYLKSNKELSNIKKGKNELYMKDSAQDKITLWNTQTSKALPG